MERKTRKEKVWMSDGKGGYVLTYVEVEIRAT